MEVLLSLGSGLAIAATVQLLLTNLGIALGLTVLDWSPSDVAAPDLDTDEALPPSEGSFPVTHLLGAGVALTLSVVLFVAALLATEFSPLVEPPTRGHLWHYFVVSVLAAVSLAEFNHSLESGEFRVGNSDRGGAATLYHAAPDLAIALAP